MGDEDMSSEPKADEGDMDAKNALNEALEKAGEEGEAVDEMNAEQTEPDQEMQANENAAASETSSETDGANLSEAAPQEDKNADETSEAPQVLVGSQSQIDINKDAVEPNDNAQLEPLNFPENVKLIISETVDYRMTLSDIEGIPSQASFAIWPDSEIASAGRNFYLLNPPVNILNTFKFEQVTNISDDDYNNTFAGSLGMFVRDFDSLSETSAFSRAIYAQLAEKQKSLILFNAYVDPDVNEIIKETQVDFKRVDFVLVQGNPQVSVRRQWMAILNKARHGEELVVLFEVRDQGLDDLKDALARQ